MGQRVGLEVSLACSEAVKLANVDVVSAYPITPQTHIVEHLAELVAGGELDAQFVPVESEHTAMSACIGASAAGARCFTSTASQGLALMHEMLYIASGLRLPIVMAVANRALSAPISIWNDHSDIMAERDIGWIQVFCENGQEVLDHTIWAFKVAEDKRIILPVAVNMDGFTLTHVIEPIDMPDQAEVDAWLPPFEPQQMLDPAKPISMGVVGMPEVYTEARKACLNVIENCQPVLEEHWKSFGQQFGRDYQPIETYRLEDAETVIVTMGSIGETCMTAIDEMRQAGQKVGQVRIRLWRPFPEKEFLAAVKDAKTLAVVDRSLQPGTQSGPVATELKSMLYSNGMSIPMANFQAGLGGRDVTRDDFKMMAGKAAAMKAGDTMTCEMVGVKE